MTKSDSGKVIKIVKVNFHFLLVVVLLLQFKLAYLNKQTEL